MKIRSLCTVVAIIALAAFASGCATVGGNASPSSDIPRNPEKLVKLPDNVRIETPTGVAPELAKFSGTWFGKWDGDLPHMLIVEKIGPDLEVVAVYALGNSQRITAQWRRVKGRVSSNGDLVIPLRSGVKATYKLEGDVLEGMYENPEESSYTRMRRVNDPVSQQKKPAG